MTISRAAIFVAFVLILGVPFALRPAARGPSKDVPRLVVVTPHVQQIRYEFALGFDRWHRARYGSEVSIDWRTPGGTTEIIKQLEAQYAAVFKTGRYELRGDRENPEVFLAPGTIGLDMVFGGGTFDHGRLKSGVPARLSWPGGPSVDVRVPMSVPAGFSQKQLDAWYGENRIGAQMLYDPQQYWLGAALSAFGIVFNRDVLRALGLPEPQKFEDLTDPRYTGWLALADPRQSGSIATSMDAILSNSGWEGGWRTLREMCANTRYFTNSSTKPPIDVSAGEAAAGLAIDFYGRGQAQAVMRPGETPETSRVGYIDPAGSVYIDADPISILRGGPHPELARRFVEFCLSDEGQTLWQFPPVGTAPDAPMVEGRRLGPERNELRRAPVRRAVYQEYGAWFVDKADLFKLASEATPKGWRSSIGVMMGAFAIDTADEQRAAWAALNKARETPGFAPARFDEMERLFYAWPSTRLPDGRVLDFTPETCKAIVAAWKEPGMMPRTKIGYTEFFAGNYRRILELAREP